MYEHHNLASGVDMVLLVSFLAVVISDVVVVTSPGQSTIFSPKVSLVMWVSDFFGLISHTVLLFVTF